MISDTERNGWDLPRFQVPEGEPGGKEFRPEIGGKM